MHCNHRNDDAGTGWGGPGLLMNGTVFTNNFN